MAEQDFENLLKIVKTLNGEINNTAKYISDLERKRASFQSQLAEGGLGTFQIKQLNEQITALSSKITGLQEKTISLQQKLASGQSVLKSLGQIDSASLKEFESTMKSIETLQKRIALGKDYQGLFKPGDSTLDKITRDLRNAEVALSSFQARARNNFTPFGTRRTPEYEQSILDAGQVSDERLASSIPASSIESSRLDEDARRAANEVGRRAVQNFYRQINKQMAEAALEEAKRNDTSAEGSVYNRLLASYQRGKQKSAPAPYFTNTPFSQSNIFGPEDDLERYTIHHGSGAGRINSAAAKQQEYNEILTRQVEERKQALADEKIIREANKHQIRILRDYLNDRTAETKIRQGLTKGDDFFLPSTAEKRAKEEERLLATLKGRVLAEERYRTVLEAAARQGFTINDLKFGRTKGTAGVEEFRFQRRDLSGVTQQLDLYNTPGGRTTAGVGNQFRSFGQGVVRDIGELTKWSIALAAVYGPLQKLRELTDEMIQNQVKLADATISVNSSFLDQSKIFDIAAESAQQAGEDVSGVIDAFTLAYRATGGGADQVQRLAQAQRLLSDSLTLSKLSTLDQAQAIDTLAAAVRQTGGNFEQTTALLDSWVRVTKVANVDLTTLATGFAVLGDAADAAGIDADQLNGIIAAIAETGVASGREVANTARAIVSGFQSDQARKELEALGVAVEDSTGKLRPFLEIMEEISSLRQGGVIDDTQFSRLTLALGGGTRRQAAYATFIENFSRVSQVAQESSRANGDAQAALAKQLDTVQTSITRLNNAFSELAQSLGVEGGFLNIIQGGVESMTALVNVFDDLVSILGKATPAMAAFITASLVLKTRGQGSLQAQLFGAGQGLIGRLPGEYEERLGQVTGASPIDLQRTRNQRRFISPIETLTGRGGLSGGIQGALLAALPAIVNATNKEDRFGGTKAAFGVAGGITGGLIGSLVGNPLIGAAIGTSIGEAFVNYTIARSTDVFGFGKAPELGTSFGPSIEGTRDEALESAAQNIYKDIGFGSEAFGRFITGGTERLAGTLVEQLNDAIQNQDKEEFNRIIGQTRFNSNINARSTLQAAGISDQLLNQAFAERKPIEFSPERVGYLRTSEAARQQFDVAEAQVLATQDVAGERTAFSELVEETKSTNRELLASLKASSKETLGQQRLSGDVRGADYARRVEALGGFDTKASTYYAAFGEQFVEINKDVTDATDAFEAFNDVIVSGIGDTVPEITSLVSEIAELVNILEDPQLNQEGFLEGLGFDNIAEVQSQLEQARETAANLMTDVYNQARLSQLNIPDIQGDITNPLSRQDYGLVSQTAQQMQNEFYQGFLELPDEMYDGLKESWDAWAQIIEDSGKIFYETVTGIDPQFFQQAIAKLTEQGLLGSQAANPFGIQQVDMPYRELQPTVDYYSQYLAQQFPQYQQNPEDVGIIFNDYVTDVLHGDNLAIKLALEKILETEQKQLEGMYNIPEGATFWVPLTAAYYRPKGGDGTGSGLPSVEGIPENTSATDANTQALRDLTAMYQTGEHLKREYGEDGQKGGGDSPLRRDPQVERFRGTRPDDRYVPMSTRHQYRYEMMNRGVTAANESQTPLQSFVEQLKQGLSQWWSNITSHQAPLSGRANVGAGGSVNSRDMTNVAPTVQARLDLRFENSTQLIVDGRVLANVITPYLASDLIKLEASQGVVTKRYVI